MMGAFTGKVMGKGLDSFRSALKKGAIFSRKSLAAMPERKDEITAALSGLIGDYLEKEGSPLAVAMGFYRDGRPLVMDSRALSEAFPDGGAKLCILVHGLMDSEEAWGFEQDPETTYGSLLERDFGYAPLYVRYNSGLHISENGRALSRLLSDLMAVFPGGVEEILLVGHSMGGLVLRSACHYGAADGEAWVKKVRKVFLLGSPNLGAYLEKISNLTAVVLRLILSPYTRIIGRIIDLRSAGIKDLRFGYLLDEDWQGRDPDRLLSNNRHAVPLLEGAEHFMVSGTVMKDPGRALSRILGDGMVSHYSSSARPPSGAAGIPIAAENTRLFPSIAHAALRNHPEVYGQIRAWLER
jgi:triacylglycerol lipase